MASLTAALCSVRCGSSDAPSIQSTNAASELGGSTLDLANASRNYLMKCSVCHGADGAPVLSSAPDLRTSNMTLEERMAIISYGKGSMPPHVDMLDKSSIRDIAVYIEEFRH